MEILGKKKAIKERLKNWESHRTPKEGRWRRKEATRKIEEKNIGTHARLSREGKMHLKGGIL